MVKYICKRCDGEWTHKGNYERHINRKIFCDGTKNDNVQNGGNVDLESKIKILEEKINNITAQNIITNNIENQTNNNIINININAFGKEDFDHITEKQCINAIRRMISSIPEAVKMIHFNVNKPENHNIYLPNKKDTKHVMVYNGEQWNLEMKQDILDNLKERGIDFIQGKFDELSKENKLTDKIKEKFSLFLEKINGDGDYEDSDVKNTISRIENDIELLLYNNKDIVLDTKNKNKIKKNTITNN